MSINKKIKTIADHFGHESQLHKLREESIETAEAASDYATTLWIENDPLEIAYYREHLIEEMADEHIMIMQMIYLMEADEEFKKQVDAKIERTLHRIETGYYA